jgi:hypothetical protein
VSTALWPWTVSVEPDPVPCTLATFEPVPVLSWTGTPVGVPAMVTVLLPVPSSIRSERRLATLMAPGLRPTIEPAVTVAVRLPASVESSSWTPMLPPVLFSESGP